MHIACVFFVVGIDPNVHFQSPIQTPGTSVPNGTRTIDDFYSGTKAALKGNVCVLYTVLQEQYGMIFVLKC